MKALALAPVLALAAFALVTPPQAEAGHRHYRGCGHGSYGRSYGYYAPSHRHAPAPHYRGGYYGYGYGYAPPPAYGYGYYGYGYAPPPAYYSGGGYGYRYGYAPPPRYCRPVPRAHVGIYFGF